MQNQTSAPTNGMMILLMVMINAIVIKEGYSGNENWNFALILTLPLLLIAIINSRQGKRITRRNFR